MADIPADHPAVARPQQVLANKSLLLAPANKVKSAVKGGSAVTSSQSTSKINALIIIGNGQESLGDGVGNNSRKYFNEAARDAFRQYTKKKGNARLVHVKSSQEMIKLIEGGSWDVVVYFGHGVLNIPELMPGYETGVTLKQNELGIALKKANVQQVYLFGCNAGYTGFARALSKTLPSANIYATFNELDVEWRQYEEEKQMLVNKFILKEPVTEYKNGLQMINGKKAKKRKREIGDPIDIDGDPLGPSLIDQ